MAELSPDLLRRVLCVFAFDGCEELFWRIDDDVLRIFALCSDFFDWGTADLEPIETEADVAALERAQADLKATLSDARPSWTGHLYAARRRNAVPAPFMAPGAKYALPESVWRLFPTADGYPKGRTE